MIKGLSIEFVQNEEDSIPFIEDTKVKGFNIEMFLNEEEKIVPDTIKIKGLSIELLDFPFYCIQYYIKRYPKGTYTNE